MISFQEQSPKFTIIMIVSTRNCSNDCGRDAGINKYILEYFDYHNKPSYIVDPFYNSNEELKQFGVMIGAKPIEKSIEDFQEILW